MIISDRAAPFQAAFATASPSASPMSSAAPIVDDNTPLSSFSMIVLKLYAFGGLAFMFSVFTAAIGYWIWIVIIKREFADSPPELDLHPERMREREKARIARLKKRQDEKLEARKRMEEAFVIPPVQYERQERGRPSSAPPKPAMRKLSISANAPLPRKSSISSSPSKGKRVSWASSMSTLDGNGILSEKPIDDKAFSNPYLSVKSPFESQDTLIQPVPRARTSLPHTATSIEERARRGHEMIAATTPDVAMSWALPNNIFEGQCRCWESVDPLDGTRQHPCQLHGYRD